VLNNGSDGPISSLWPPLGAGGVARGYNVLVFDGPGQQSVLFESNLPFRYDWEQVIGPVVDFLLARSDVDPARIALYGISQAGYWVPRRWPLSTGSPPGLPIPACTTPSSPGGERCQRRCADAWTLATRSSSTD
jgi:hypothetical protein